MLAVWFIVVLVVWLLDPDHGAFRRAPNAWMIVLGPIEWALMLGLPTLTLRWFIVRRDDRTTMPSESDVAKPAGRQKGSPASARLWISRWHVAQLVMAWVAVALATFGFSLMSISANTSSSPILRNRDLAVRDSVAKLEPNLTRVRDSVRMLVAAQIPTFEIEAFIRQQGFQEATFKGPTRADVLRARALKYGVAYPAILLTCVLPVAVFVATWLWFGARAKPPSPSGSTAANEETRYAERH